MDVTTLHSDGLTVKDIAARLGVTRKTVYTRLRNAGLMPNGPNRHPLHRSRTSVLGIKRGTPHGDVSEQVAQRILDVACRHNCSLWEAVERMLG